jgi:hypothetical protein
MSGRSPAVFRATVCRRCSARDHEHARRRTRTSTGTTACRGRIPTQPAADAGYAPQAAVGGDRRKHAADREGVPRLRLHDVERRGRLDGALELGPAPPEGIGEREQDAMDFLLLLLLERHDVVVDLDGAERLEEQARAARRAAVHDAGDRPAVLGADDEHVAAAAVGDDLLLQILRGVLAAQVGLERAAEARPLLPQTIAKALQLGLAS